MYWATTPKARVTTAKYKPGSRTPEADSFVVLVFGKK